MSEQAQPRQGRARPAVAVCCDSADAADQRRARDLAGRLGLPVVDCVGATVPLLLAVTPERLELRQTDRSTGPVFVEFVHGRFGFRSTQALTGELIARAVGFKGESLEVIDATAGLGRDAMVLALLGCRVTAMEADPIVSVLLDDGLRRAGADIRLAAAVERIRLVQRSSIELLRALPPDQAPDVIYLDPMFPERTGSALAKKEMALLARLVGPEDDPAALLAAALASGAQRVVLKRPRVAPPVLVEDGPPAALRFVGRAARFDVYFPRKQR